MSFYLDNAFTFTSESDLLPIWYTAPDPFQWSNFPTDDWDDPFAPDPTPTFETPSEYPHEGGYVNMTVVQPPPLATTPYDSVLTLPTGDVFGCESVGTVPYQDQVESGNDRDPHSMGDVVPDVHWERPAVIPQGCYVTMNEENFECRREIPYSENNFVMKEQIPEENFEKEEEDQLTPGGFLNDEKISPSYEMSGSTSQEESGSGEGSPREDENSDLVLLSGVDDPIDFKLPASKSPIMEAMVVCAIKNWGISIAKSTPSQVIFRVTDFDHYYKISRSICSKQHPTEDIGSRVKSLRRWFENFPKKKDRQDNPNFLLAVKPSGTKKVNEMIERNTRLLGVQKRRRRQ